MDSSSDNFTDEEDDDDEYSTDTIAISDPLPGFSAKHLPSAMTGSNEESDGEMDQDKIFASGGPVLRPMSEMEPEEGFVLREWRRQNDIILEEKERMEKVLRTEITTEADDYKRALYENRILNRETNKALNREKEKIFLANREEFYANADKHYWKAISELIPNEMANIEKKGKKDKENKPSIIFIQGPKPGKPTDLSRMRQIVLKLKHAPQLTPKFSPPAAAAAVS
ncbi:clathrin light chain 1-like [Typha latifolia]|uniref:clathrin light chain 1-like n=1 Tax=Typha latifolia TaxID=4733 RepID=UPI003C2EFEF0